MRIFSNELGKRLFFFSVNEYILRSTFHDELFAVHQTERIHVRIGDTIPGSLIRLRALILFLSSLKSYSIMVTDRMSSRFHETHNFFLS